MHKLGKRIPLDEMPPVPVYKLSHIVLRSADVGAARDWYMAVINARMVFEADDGMGCALTFDEEHHRLLIVGPVFPAAHSFLASPPDIPA